jgi:tetratricopeptide (TPR) repeat protein
LTPRANLPQVDFELEFFDRILAQNPDYVDVLRVQATNLSTKGLHSRGLAADRRIVQLRPNDPNAHYNLACSYALMKMDSAAIAALRSCLKLGYRDFEHLMCDPDLEHLRKDSRFLRLLGRYVAKAVRNSPGT